MLFRSSRLQEIISIQSSDIKQVFLEFLKIYKAEGLKTQFFTKEQMKSFIEHMDKRDASIITSKGYPLITGRESDKKLYSDEDLYVQDVIKAVATIIQQVGTTHIQWLGENFFTGFEKQIADAIRTRVEKLDFYPDKNIEHIDYQHYSDKMTGGFEVDRLWVKQAEIQSFTPSTTLPDYAAIPTNIDLSKPDTKKITQYVKSFSDYFEYIKDIMFVDLESGLKSFTGSRGLAGLRQINVVLDYGKKLFDTLPMFHEISEQILSLSANDTDLSPQQLKKFQRVNKNLFNLLTEAYKSSALIPTLTTSAKSYFDQTSQANIVTTSMSGEDFAQAATAKSVSVMLKDLFQKGAKSIFFKAIQNISTADIFPMDTEYSPHIVRALEYLNLQISKYSGSWAEIGRAHV